MVRHAVSALVQRAQLEGKHFIHIIKLRVPDLATTKLGELPSGLGERQAQAAA